MNTYKLHEYEYIELIKINNYIGGTNKRIELGKKYLY